MHYPQRTRLGFTLLELMTVIVIMGILVALLVPLFAQIRQKSERGHCTRNLTGLYVAASIYTQEKGSWPQIGTRDTKSPRYAKAWSKALAPYGIGPVNWICPSIQRAMGSPDYKSEKNLRIDYSGTAFGTHYTAPHRWPTHPWFIERGDMHGDGNLIIFANGQVKSLQDVRRDTTRQVR